MGAVTVSVSPCVCQSYCVLKDAVSLELFSAFDSLDLSISSSIAIPESRRQRLDEDIPFTAELSKVPPSLHVVPLWVSVIVPVDYKKFL